MRVGSKFRLVLVALLAFGIAVLATVVIARVGGPSRSSSSAGGQGASTGSTPTVTVVRQTVAEVLSLSASVAASPQFAVDSVNTATIQPKPGIEPGSYVPAGTPLFVEGDAIVRAPVDSTVVSWQTTAASRVVAHLPVLTLRYRGFGMSATVAAVDAYRILNNQITANAEILNGPGPFPCTVLPSATASSSETGPGPTSTDAGSSVTCAIPPSVTAYDGLAGLVALTSGVAVNALVLPAYAVLGTAQRGEVYLVDPDGTTRVRAVGLGVTNGGSVQITSGLTVGDRVLANPPTLTGSS